MESKILLAEIEQATSAEATKVDVELFRKICNSINTIAEL